MDRRHKTIFQAAVLIREQLAKRGPQYETIYLPEYAWNQIHRLQRRIAQARERGWHGAVQQLMEDLGYALGDCKRDLDTALKPWTTPRPAPTLASVADIYHDLLALDAEFPDVEIDQEEHEIRVTTDRIILEEVRLGRFQIRLDWHRLADEHPYHVVARDPNPAGGNERVTHPHVQDELLCEGDGRAAIRGALRQCRLYDLFMLISQVLHTYGAGSAYVPLENWDGEPCSDCGASVSEDNRYYCSHCESTLCDGCALECASCNVTHCAGCLQKCAKCRRHCCFPCLATCPVCRQYFCKHCRKDGLCLACYEKKHQEEQSHDPSDNDSQHEQPGRIGEQNRAPECVAA